MTTAFLLNSCGMVRSTALVFSVFLRLALALGLAVFAARRPWGAAFFALAFLAAAGFWGGRLDLNAGASLNREFFMDGLNWTSGEALPGRELFFKLNSRVSFSEKFALFPNLTERGVARMNADPR